MSTSGLAASKPKVATPEGRSLLPLAICASLAMLILCGLGVWQLQRGALKQAFIASITQAIAAPPKTDWNATAPFERVKLDGRYDPAGTVFVRVTLAEGLGVYVMTPLVASDTQRRIFVNRGFLKTAQDGRPLAVDTPAAPVSITGLRREPETRGWFATVDEPATRTFAVRDPQGFARTLNLGTVEADYVEAEPASVGAPRPGGAILNGVDPREVIARIPDNHLAYALTWFGLAATLAGVFAVLARGIVTARRREPTA